MRRKNREDFSVGQDSFLDTTANLVGILIILVVVIGTKTKIDAVEYSKQQALAEPEPEIESDRREARAIQQSIQDQKVRLIEYDLEQEYRQTERDRLLVELAQTRESVQQELDALDDQKRELVEQSKAVQSLENDIKEAERQAGIAEETERPKIVLEHLPTPMARTVFTKEMHVQLKDGKISVIPWDRMIQMFKQQVPLAMRRNGSRREIEDTLGPVGGFLMHYRMNAIPGGFELDRFELETTSSAPIEDLKTAWSTAGRLRLELASRDPGETVVTVWVYPDSFDEFRNLKARMFDEGFLSAARPLPAGVRIGASPRGSRSSAQ